MPAPQLAKHFHPRLGRPTKELSAIAGLLLIKEFLNLTVAEAVEADLFRKDDQFALNVPSLRAELSERILQRYEQLFRGDALARKVMEDVTRKLVRLLESDVRDARLDSNHLTGDSRKLSRTALVKTVIRRMLACLETHSPDDYGGLPEEFRRRHLVATGQTERSGRLQGPLGVRRSPGIDRWVQSTNLHWKAA